MGEVGCISGTMKTKKILVKLDETDIKDITVLAEKKYALENLKKIIRDNSDLLNRCNEEVEQVTDLYNNWWDRMIDQYNFSSDILHNLIVDCEKGEIFLYSE